MSDFDGGFGPLNFKYIREIYRLEDISEEKALEYCEYLEKKYPEKYNDFLEYKQAMEYNISNLKEALLHGEDPIINEDILSKI